MAPNDRPPVVEQIEIVGYDTAQTEYRIAAHGQDNRGAQEYKLIGESHLALLVDTTATGRGRTARRDYLRLGGLLGEFISRVRLQFLSEK